MDIKTKEIYSEVYSVLNMVGDTYINKLPANLLKMIKEEKNESYDPQYVATKKLSEQNIKRESLSIIALLYLNYWCNSSEERQNLKQLFKSNEEKYQKEIRGKYNPDNLFKKQRIYSDNDVQNEVAIVEYKESIFNRIINKIKMFFYR